MDQINTATDEVMRAAFEAGFSKLPVASAWRDMLERRPDGQYHSVHAQLAWESWQAAARSIGGWVANGGPQAMRSRIQPADGPGLGDDIPCEKCGAVALDTGLECDECGHDNYEAVCGVPFLSLAGKVACGSHVFDLVEHLNGQRAFSLRTFGPGARAEMVIDHIRKELVEIEANPHDVVEWIDVVLLALDGAWRTGATPEQITHALVAKQAKNEARTWPDWRTQPLDRAIEHTKTEA